MRGKNIFNKLTEDLPISCKKKIGRDERLINKRNEVLIYTYYYLIRVKRKNFNDSIDTLIGIFFLSARTIVDIVQKNTKTLERIKVDRPSNKELERKINFLNLKSI